MRLRAAGSAQTKPRYRLEAEAAARDIQPKRVP
jgi:hypothetical protein